MNTNIYIYNVHIYCIYAPAWLITPRGMVMVCPPVDLSWLWG